MNDLADTIKNKLSELKVTNIAFFLGICGIVLIGISSLWDTSQNENEQKVKEDEALSLSPDDYKDYAAQKEAQLEELLESVNGVGKANVMVNIECSCEYIYAVSENKNSSYDETSSSYDYSYDYFVTEQNGDTLPLMTKVLYPKISSCVVVCEGASNAVVCENVYKTISAALNIPISDIFVAQLS